jgi:hypothetical protein
MDEEKLKELLTEKINKMPNIRSTINRVEKDGKTVYVFETRITQFFSEKYMNKVRENKQEQPRKSIF